MTDPYASLRVPAFRRFIAFLAAQTFATMVQGVAVGWQLYAVTHDPLSLGLVGLAEALPFIGFALPAGHLADRIDRRRLSLVALAVLSVCSAALLSASALGLIREQTGRSSGQRSGTRPGPRRPGRRAWSAAAEAR